LGVTVSFAGSLAQCYARIIVGLYPAPLIRGLATPTISITVQDMGQAIHCRMRCSAIARFPCLLIAKNPNATHWRIANATDALRNPAAANWS
jgi:hypothetical protein